MPPLSKIFNFSAMVLMAAISTMMPLSISVPISRPIYNRPHDSRTSACLSSSSSSSSDSKSSLPREPRLPSATSSSIPLVVEPSGQHESGLNYALANPNGNPVARIATSAESTIERVIRFTSAAPLFCFVRLC